MLEHVHLRDVAVYALSKVAPGLAGLAMVVVFVRLLGAETYGRYALQFAVASSAAAMGIGWLNQGQLRFWSLHAENSIPFETAVRRGHLLAIVVACGLGLFAVPVSRAVGLSNLSLLDVAAPTLLAIAVMGHLTRLAGLQARMNAQRFVRLELLRSIAIVAVPFALFAVLGVTDQALLLGVAAGYAATRAFGQPWTSTDITRSDPNVTRILTAMWDYGWPISLWLGGMQLFLVTDRVLIQHYMGFEVTGLYAGVYDVVMKFYTLLFYPISMATHPRIMKAWNEGDAARAHATIRSALLLQAVLFVPIVLLYSLAGDSLLAVLVPGYGVEVTSLAVPLAIGGMLWQAALVVHKGLEMAAATGFMLVAMAAALTVNATVGYFGLPRLGVSAAPLATVSAAAVYITLCLGYYRLNRVGSVQRPVA
jgi:O-antigen/teichoic acid export membrane protein